MFVGDPSDQVKRWYSESRCGARASARHWFPSQSILDQKRRLMDLSTDARPSNTQRQGLQELASGFEDAWKAATVAAEAPTLGAFLPPPQDSSREQALQELIQIDLAMRCQRGKPICLEEYLEKFPELASMPKLLTRLLYAEYCIRQEHGDKPHQSVYQV